MTPLFINYNGEILPANTKLLTIANRGFRYGDGLFESMRLMKGKVKFVDLHAERLHKVKHARLRLTVYRDAEGLYTPTQNKAGYALELQPMDEPRYFLNTRGLIMDMYSDVPKAINMLSNYKTCNSMLFVMAGIYKAQNKLDDAFILNQNGFLCETISANVFVLYQNHLYTPALSEGCIGGVMRQVVMDLAIKNGIPMTEAQLDPEILNQADEVFITNASRGIQWVMGFGKKRYFNEISKVLADELNKL
jgi:branched-subunit amino acid aminotransferase/4-amino-4-deoxychorismate lyase